MVVGKGTHLMHGFGKEWGAGDLRERKAGFPAEEDAPWEAQRRITYLLEGPVCNGGTRGQGREGLICGMMSMLPV